MRKIAIPKTSSFILGLIFTFALAWVMYDDFYSWLLIDQTFFHLPLFAAVVALIWGRINFFSLSILLCLSYVIADYGVIDETLHEYFLQWKVFPQIWIHGGVVNPQYTKLLLYLFVIVALLVKVSFKRYRTNDTFFILLSCISSLAVTAVIHYPVIRQGLETHLRHEEEQLSRLLDVVSSSPQPQKSAELLQQICQSQDYECLQTPKLDVVNQTLDQAMAGQHHNKIYPGTFETPHPKVVRSAGYFEDHEFRRFVMGVSFSRSTSQYSLIMEKQRVNALQKQYEDIFSELAACAHFVWGWLFITLGLMHKSKWKNRILVPAQRVTQMPTEE